jgi:hypothetical protein
MRISPRDARFLRTVDVMRRSHLVGHIQISDGTWQLAFRDCDAQLLGVPPDASPQESNDVTASLDLRDAPREPEPPTSGWIQLSFFVDSHV